MNRAYVLAVAVSLSVACSDDREPEAPGHSAPAITAADVAWSLETGGRPLAVTAHPGGDVTLAHEPSFHVFPGDTVVQRRSAEGAARWYLDFPERIAAALAAAPDGGAVLVLLEMDTVAQVHPARVAAAEILHVSADGEITARWPEPGDATLSSLAATPSGDVVAVWERQDGSGAVLRRRAPDGALLLERELPVWSAAALDASGAVHVVSPCAIERWTDVDEVAWHREFPCDRGSLHRIAVLADGSVVASGAIRRDLTWGAETVVYEPDRYFNPAPLLVGLDWSGEPAWARTIAVGTRGEWDVPAIGLGGAVWTSYLRDEDGRARECTIRVDGAGGAPAWERAADDYWPGEPVASGDGLVVLTGSMPLGGGEPEQVGPVTFTHGFGWAIALRR